jgi:hypothetical protein
MRTKTGRRSGASPVAVDQLLSSRPVRLSMLFSDMAVGGAARRARTVKAKAAENFEERGLQTLFLAWGMVTWSNVRGTAVPAAPVLLRQAVLTARGGAGEDFDASLPGEWEINPTLLHRLRTDYQVDAGRAGLLGLLREEAEPPDLQPLFERLAKAAAAVLGFSVAPRSVLGNFSYAKLPMVQDLETATDTLLGSEVKRAGRIPERRSAQYMASAAEVQGSADRQGRSQPAMPYSPTTVPLTGAGPSAQRSSMADTNSPNAGSAARGL